MTDWSEIIAERTAQMKNLRGGTPDVMRAFSDIAQAALAGKALDGKTKELIALGISVAIRCDDFIAFHAKAALRQGATRDEVIEALGMAVYMGAGPSVMYATTHSTHSHNLKQLVLKRFKNLPARKLCNQKRWNQLILHADARDAGARSAFRLRRDSTSALCRSGNDTISVRVDVHQIGLTALRPKRTYAGLLHLSKVTYTVANTTL